MAVAKSRDQGFGELEIEDGRFEIQKYRKIAAMERKALSVAWIFTFLTALPRSGPQKPHRKPREPVGDHASRWLQVAEDSFRSSQAALFPRPPSADLKMGAIARIVVECRRIRQSGHSLLRSAGEYCATLLSGVRSKPGST